MGKIIELNEDDNKFYINTDYIIYFAVDPQTNRTEVYMLTGKNRMLAVVKETPEEIMKLINGEE